MLKRRTATTANKVEKKEEVLETKKLLGKYLSVMESFKKENGKYAFRIKFQGLKNDGEPLEIEGLPFIQVGTFTCQSGETPDDYKDEDGNWIFSSEDVFSVEAKLMPYTGDKEELKDSNIWIFNLYDGDNITAQSKISDFMKLI